MGSSHTDRLSVDLPNQTEVTDDEEIDEAEAELEMAQEAAEDEDENGGMGLSLPLDEDGGGDVTPNAREKYGLNSPKGV